MRPRVIVFALALLLASVSQARAEDFGPLYTILGCGAIASVLFGIASTAWVAIKSRRPWIWFLTPVFIAVWIGIFLVGFALYANR